MKALTKDKLVETYMQTTAALWIQTVTKRMKKLNRLELIERLRELERDLLKKTVGEIRDLIHNASQQRLSVKYSGYRAKYILPPTTLKGERSIDTTGLRARKIAKPVNKFAVLLPKPKPPLVIKRQRATYATQVRRMVAKLQ